MYNRVLDTKIKGWHQLALNKQSNEENWDADQLGVEHHIANSNERMF